MLAWDFPTLSDPADDAARAAALQDGADGFAADIETAAEGTYLTLAASPITCRSCAPPPATSRSSPSFPSQRAPGSTSYPYDTEALFADAFAPMVYWSCTEPGAAVASAIAVLARLRPVTPIGQDYDMASEGGRHGLPSAHEIWRFLDVAQRSGAFGASLYDLESGGAKQLAALAGFPWSNGGGG